MSVDVESPAALALRKLQIVDELCELGEHRWHLTAAQSILGELLRLDCTGETELNPDGSATFSHNGPTCPIHEWLVPDDHPAIDRPDAIEAFVREGVARGHIVVSRGDDGAERYALTEEGIEAARRMVG